MKYVWLVALILFMAGTWALGTPDRDAKLALLAQRQDEFAQLITDSIMEKQPDVKDVIFNQLYIETIKPERELRAHFRYQIDAPARDGEATEQVMEGTSLLRTEDGGDSWQLVDTTMTQPFLGFKNGLVISSHASGTQDETSDNVPATDKSNSTGSETEPELKQ